MAPLATVAPQSVSPHASRRRRDVSVSRRREQREPRDATRGDAWHPERDTIERPRRRLERVKRLEHAKRERRRFFRSLR